MGYKLAGCDVIGNVEIDKKMNEIYVKNHHPKYNFCMDIRDFNKLSDDEIPSELFNLDILDGSPPCMPFSMAGNREKNWGKEKKFKEGQAVQILDDLFFHFIETTNKLKPKIVIAENVEGILLGNAWKYVQDIYKGFKEIGYNVKHYLLKGEYMGIPQTRHRVFFIAVRNDLNTEKFFDKLDLYFNYKPITYGEIKSGVGVPLRKDSVLYQTLLLVKECDSYLEDTLKRNGQKPKFFNYSIARENCVLNTQPAKNTILRGKGKTYLSLEDIIHSQTFPEDYDFIHRTISTVTYVCGMSVPPLMIKRIVKRIIETGILKEKE